MSFNAAPPGLNRSFGAPEKSAAMASLDVDADSVSHYYHCVMSQVPHRAQLPKIAECIVPRPSSEVIARLAALGFRIVPHRLHMYREPIETKFGYVTFYVHCAANASGSDDELHELVVKWIQVDLVAQVKEVVPTVVLSLAQPPGFPSSAPFLTAINMKASFFSPIVTADTKKMETFILTRVTFNTDTLDSVRACSVRELQSASADNATTTSDMTEPPTLAEEVIGGGVTDEGVTLSLRGAAEHHRKKQLLDPDEWGVVGTFNVDGLKPLELQWLNREVNGFPTLKVLAKEGKVTSVSVERDALVAFFEPHLAPLLAVE